MKIKQIIILILILLPLLAITACSGNSKEYIGKYVSGNAFIVLNSDGTFVAENYIKLAGEYTVNGEDVEFDVQEMNGEKLSNKAKGKIKGDSLTGPDGLEYTKDSDK